jgi:hypothetical protein
MKKTHILLLVAIAIAIGVLVTMSADFSTYDYNRIRKAETG